MSDSVSQPRVSTIATTPDPVLWSNGVTYDGVLWIAVSLPSTYTQPFLFHASKPTKLPRSIRVEIAAGKLDNSIKLYYTEDLNPPSTSYYAKWYDLQGNLIASTASPFTVSADTTTLTVPTLTVPTSGSAPTPQS